MLCGGFASSLASYLFDLNVWLKSGGHHSVTKGLQHWVVFGPLSNVLKMNLYDRTTSLSPSFVVSCLSICHRQKTREIYPKITYSVCICRGADLSALVREASICALRQEMALQNTQSKKGKKALQK